jgi:hypothetical protein
VEGAWRYQLTKRIAKTISSSELWPCQQAYALFPGYHLLVTSEHLFAVENWSPLKKSPN